MFIGKSESICLFRLHLAVSNSCLCAVLCHCIQHQLDFTWNSDGCGILRETQTGGAVGRPNSRSYKVRKADSGKSGILRRNHHFVECCSSPSAGWSREWWNEWPRRNNRCLLPGQSPGRLKPVLWSRDDGLETRVHWSSFCPGLGLGLET